jgi:ankyrin repeat protein
MISTIFGDVAIETAGDRAARMADARGINLITLIHNGQTHAALSEISAGANVNIRSLGGNWTPLGAAAAMGDAEVTRALLKAGARVDAKDVQGRTALGIAEAYGHKAVATQLKKAAPARPKAGKPAAKKTRRKKPAAKAPS